MIFFPLVSLLLAAPLLYQAAALPVWNPPTDNMTYSESNEPRSGDSWTLTDEWKGKNFFDGWKFFAEDDPTHGIVDYVDAETAWNTGLVYFDEAQNQAVMQVDSWTDLGSYQKRPSVRISSEKRYAGGLFILDVAQVPTGCATWPAFWLLGAGSWPSGGEIDVVEGVNGGALNQASMHTSEGCYMTTPGRFYGQALGESCASSGANNNGCGSIDTRPNSLHGPAVYAAQWDGDGVKVWSFSPQEAPQDIWGNSPTPQYWPVPAAAWAASRCDPYTYMKDMEMIFDITLCGDWAGSAYANSGCPGTCEERVMTGSNFIDAKWRINSLRVFTNPSTSAQTHIGPGQVSQVYPGEFGSADGSSRVSAQVACAGHGQHVVKPGERLYASLGILVSRARSASRLGYLRGELQERTGVYDEDARTE